MINIDNSTLPLVRDDTDFRHSSDVPNLSPSMGLAPRRPGRPIGTRKRQLSEGVCHLRLNVIRAVILKMDPSDRHIWSRRGHPKTAYLQKVTAIPDIAQWEISRSCPGLRRANAANFKMDMSNLTLHQGGWRFQMLRGSEYVRRNLRTADLELARKIRDWYCISGNWDYPVHFLVSEEA